MKKILITALVLLITGSIAYGISLCYFNNLTKNYKDCPFEKKLVCATDDYTYVNECFMEKAGAVKRYDGECSLEKDLLNASSTVLEESKCNIECIRYDPVCGIDGRTYACGEPEANCNKVEVASKGECPISENCICTMEYNPVCGKNGETYGNACGAKCAKVEVDYKGECEGKTGVTDPCLLSDMESREKCKLKE